MIKGLIRVLMVVAILFCSLDAPLLAQSTDAATTHQVATGDSVAAADEPAGGEEPSPMPDHSMHHHCPGGVLCRASNITDTANGDPAERFVLTTAAMTSRSEAPPIQPPSA